MSARVGTREDDNRRTLVRLAIVAAVMFGFGFAMVPFYDAFCAAAGINTLGKDDTEYRNTQVDASRLVTVEFDSNAHGLPWRFRPLVRSVQVHPGQLATVEFEVENQRDAAVTGQAVPSYGPQRAGQYFHKIECFCFTQQKLAARETRTMPVVFVVDPALPKDVSTLTLSYTFFAVPGLEGRT